jgi:hypothetical protein
VGNFILALLGILPLAVTIVDLEREPDGADYPPEDVLTRINRMGDILRQGKHKQQKRAINVLFDRILVGPMSRIRGVELHNRAQPLFADRSIADCDDVCPRDLERTPCRHPCGIAPRLSSL